MDKTVWQKVAWGSSEFALTIALRHTLLRAPLGLHFAKEALETEKDSIHLAGFDPNGALRACLVLRPSVTPSWLEINHESNSYQATIAAPDLQATIAAPGLQAIVAAPDLQATVAAPAFHMRQVAVRQDLQGLGLGRELMNYAHSWVVANSPVRQVYLHARSPVVGFYENAGYTLYGEPFWEVGLEHRAMHRFLES
jgi:predicted GNAT family N-acyltransferase